MAKMYKDTEGIKLEITKQEVYQLLVSSDPGESYMGIFGTNALLQKISTDVIYEFEKYISFNGSILEGMDRGNGILLTMPSSSMSIPNWKSIWPRIL